MMQFLFSYLRRRIFYDSFGQNLTVNLKSNGCGQQMILPRIHRRAVWIRFPVAEYALRRRLCWCSQGSALPAASLLDNGSGRNICPIEHCTHSSLDFLTIANFEKFWIGPSVKKLRWSSRINMCIRSRDGFIKVINNWAKKQTHLALRQKSIFNLASKLCSPEEGVTKNITVVGH